MGAWSATIMGGDTPLDARGEILEILGVDWEQEEELTAEIINANLRKLYEAFCDNEDERDPQEIMVLGYVIMETGALLSSNIQVLVKDAVVKEQQRIQNWVDPMERKFYLDDFYTKLMNYESAKGPVEFPVEGLFEKMAEHLAEPTDLQLLRAAFDKIGITYRLGQEEGYTYIVPCEEEYDRFFEFDETGKIASY